MRHLSGLREIAPEYDGFVLDLWGVIHDGVSPYPGAIECLQRLRAEGKRTVLLSNAPRRAHAAQAAMRAMGIADDIYDAILTSGEQTWSMLRDRTDPFFAALGSRVFHLGPERDRNVFEGIDVELVDRPEAAQCVVNTGPDDHTAPTDPEPWDPVLESCLAAELPMVCANPDLEVIRDGRRVICAGLLTQRYETMGGRARWIGKPDPAIYLPALSLLSLPDGGRILAVGDSLRTDIVGAAAAGLPSCWITGGIHRDELAGNRDAAAAKANGAGLSPSAALETFVW